MTKTKTFTGNLKKVLIDYTEVVEETQAGTYGSLHDAITAKLVEAAGYTDYKIEEYLTTASDQLTLIISHQLFPSVKLIVEVI